jgi:hypothetical protein
VFEKERGRESISERESETARGTKRGCVRDRDRERERERDTSFLPPFEIRYLNCKFDVIYSWLLIYVFDFIIFFYPCQIFQV